MASSDKEKNNEQKTEASNSSQELEQLIHQSTEPKTEEAEEAVIESTATPKESTPNKTAGAFKMVIVLWLTLLSGAMAYAMMVIDKDKQASLNQHPIVFYPFGKAFSTLKSQGYDFAAIEKYNNNMIQILNSEGKVVLPAASVHGKLPDSLVVKLMSVDEMNRLASQQSE